MKRFTLLTNDPEKAVFHFKAETINEAKKKGDSIAASRQIEKVSILEGWTQPVGYIEEGKEVIKVG